MFLLLRVLMILLIVLFFLILERLPNNIKILEISLLIRILKNWEKFEYDVLSEIFPRRKRASKNHI